MITAEKTNSAIWRSTKKLKALLKDPIRDPFGWLTDPLMTWELCISCFLKTRIYRHRSQWGKNYHGGPSNFNTISSAQRHMTHFSAVSQGVKEKHTDDPTKRRWRRLPVKTNRVSASLVVLPRIRISTRRLRALPVPHYSIAREKLLLLKKKCLSYTYLSIYISLL
jgi:hypothetical protein